MPGARPRRRYGFEISEDLQNKRGCRPPGPATGPIETSNFGSSKQGDIGKAMAAKGMFLFPVAGFGSGMRQMAIVNRPIVRPEDFAGMKFRALPGQMMIDTFKAFGAEPITTTADQIYDALNSGRVEAQDKPLAILEGIKFYEVVKYVSLTGHMWAGFNLMAHLPTWKALPDDINAVVERNATRYILQQRADQAKLNADRWLFLPPLGLGLVLYPMGMWPGYVRRSSRQMMHHD